MIQSLPPPIGAILVTMFLAGCGALANPTQSPLQPPSPLPLPAAPQAVDKPILPNQPAGACRPDQVSTLGVLRSKDHGATWTDLGDACIQGLSTIKPADPTGLVVDGRIMLYFTDLFVEQPKTLYRITSADGVNFDMPKATFTMDRPLYDPSVVRMPDGSFRAYVPTGPDGITSAKSSDGIQFTQENGAREMGDMPGALVLADNRIRLFFNEVGKNNTISSAISKDGLNFVRESGARISKPADYMYINNPQPIRLRDGTYLMLYQIQDREHKGRPDWKAEIHLATSKDGLNWPTNSKIVEYGGTSCVVEMPDGTLIIYYGR